MKTPQSFPHGLSDQVPHRLLIAKSDFTFGGVDVHVHAGRIDFKEQATNRIASFHERGVIAFQQRKVQSPVFYRATIYKQVLGFSRGAGDARLADEAPDLDFRSRLLDLGLVCL